MTLNIQTFAEYLRALSHRPSINPFAVGLILCNIVALVFNLLFFNTYFPLSEGWFSFLARLSIEGQLPYRDFHLFLPPLYLIQTTIFIDLFGYSFLYLRIYGIIIILLIITILYLLYSHLFPTYIAMFISIISLLYYESRITFISYDFFEFFSLYSLLSALFLCVYYESSGIRIHRMLDSILYLIMSGFFASLAFLTKQSNGFFVLLFLSIAVILCGLYSKRKSLFHDLMLFSLGIAIPLTVVTAYLLYEGLWSYYIETSWSGGAQAKGGPATILFGWIPKFFTFEYMTYIGLLLLFILVLRYEACSFYRFAQRKHPEYSFGTTKTLILCWILFVSSLLCVLGPYNDQHLSHILTHSSFFCSALYRSLVPLGAATAFFIFGTSVFQAFSERHSDNRKYATLIVLSSLSLGLLLGTGTSGALDYGGSYLPIGMLFGLLLLVKSPFNLGKLVATVVCFIILLHVVSLKYETPYNWWWLKQPDVRTASASSNHPFLKGMLLHKDTRDVIDGVTEAILDNTQPSDPIYVFPHMPLFYLLSDRTPPTFSKFHWFDVVSDAIAEKDAELLSKNPPRMLIVMELPEAVWTDHEKWFRGGNASSERKLADTIYELINEKNIYHLLTKYQVAQNNVLKVWLRDN